MRTFFSVTPAVLLLILVTFVLATTVTVSAQATQPSRLEYYDTRGYKLQVEATTIAGWSSGGTAGTGGGGNSNATGDGDLYNTGRMRLPHHVAYNSKKNLVYTNDVPFVGGALKVLDLTKQTMRTVCGQQPTRVNKDGACGLDGKSGVGALKVSYAYMIYDATRDYLYAMDSVDTSIHRIDMSQYDGANSPPIITTVTQPWTNTTACPPELKAGTAFSSMPYNSSTSRFCKPTSITLDETRNILFVADYLFGGIIQIDFTNKIVSSTVVGQIGSILPATIAKVFYRPGSNSLMVGTSDATCGPVRTASCNVQIATYSLTKKSLIADYPAPTIPPVYKQTSQPSCMYYYIQGADDNQLIVYQQAGTQIQQLNLTNNATKILGGQWFGQDYGAPGSTVDGPANTTWYNHQALSGMFLDTAASNLYLADWQYHRISRINLLTSQSQWLGGGGRTGTGISDGTQFVDGGLSQPWSLELWPNNNTLLFIDTYSTRARGIKFPSYNITSVNGGSWLNGHTDHHDACDSSLFGSITNNYLYMGFLTRVMRVDPLYPANLFIPALTCMSYLNSSSNAVVQVAMERVPNLTMNAFGSIPDMQITSDGNSIFWIQQWKNLTGVLSNTIIRSKPKDVGSRLAWKDTIICGNGGLFSRSDGQCGQGGYSGVATMQHPNGLALDEKSKRLYLADGHQIRYLYPYDSDTPTLTTLIGKGLTYSSDGPASIASFNSLQFMTIGTFNGKQYIWATDAVFMNVRMVDISNVSNPIAYTIAGPTGTLGDAVISNTQWIDGIGAQIRFNFPLGIAFDGVDILYVADRDNNKIRQLKLSYPQAAPSSSSSSTGKSSSSSSSSSTSTSSSTATTVSSTSTSTSTSTAASSSSTQQSTGTSSSTSDSSTSTSSSTSTDSSTSTSSSTSSSTSPSSSDSIVGSSSSTGGSDTGAIGGSQMITPSITSSFFLLLSLALCLVLT